MLPILKSFLQNLAVEKQNIDFYLIFKNVTSDEQETEIVQFLKQHFELIRQDFAPTSMHFHALHVNVFIHISI